jgi:hypothetical protein
MENIPYSDGLSSRDWQAEAARQLYDAEGLSSAFGESVDALDPATPQRVLDRIEAERGEY